MGHESTPPTGAKDQRCDLVDSTAARNTQDGHWFPHQWNVCRRLRRRDQITQRTPRVDACVQVIESRKKRMLPLRTPRTRRRSGFLPQVREEDASVRTWPGGAVSPSPASASAPGGSPNHRPAREVLQETVLHGDTRFVKEHAALLERARPDRTYHRTPPTAADAELHGDPFPRPRW